MTYGSRELPLARLARVEADPRATALPPRDPICVELEICDDSPAPERRIPTIVVRERKTPAHEVMIVDDAMIIGVPTEPRIALPRGEAVVADRTLPQIMIKHGPNIPGMIGAFLVCFSVSAFGSMLVALHNNEPQPMQMPAPPPAIEATVDVAIEETTVTASVRPARKRVPAATKKKVERKWDPLRSNVIFRASDI